MKIFPHRNADHWREYFGRVGPRLLIFARQWLPNVADAEDVIQEVFVRFWRRYPHAPDEHLGLLFAMVRTVALDHIRSEARRHLRERTAAETDFPPDGTMSMEAALFKSPGGSGLPPMEPALQRLPAEQREVLVLKIWGELTFAQIAEALEIPPNTAASRYRYAISSLRKILQPVCHE